MSTFVFPSTKIACAPQESHAMSTNTAVLSVHSPDMVTVLVSIFMKN